MTLEITSERHQTDYDLDWIITKRASETTAGVSRLLFISTYPTIRLRIWDVLFWEATSKRQQTDSFVNKRWYINSKGVNEDLAFLSPYSYFHQCCRTLTSTSNNNTEVWRQKQSYIFFYSHLLTVHHWGRTQECSKVMVV